VSTVYEIGFYGPDGRIAAIGSTCRKTKSALLRAMLQRGREILAYADIPDGEGFEWVASANAWVWSGYSVKFTGETWPSVSV